MNSCPQDTCELFTLKCKFSDYYITGKSGRLQLYIFTGIDMSNIPFVKKSIMVLRLGNILALYLQTV